MSELVREVRMISQCKHCFRPYNSRVSLADRASELCTRGSEEGAGLLMGTTLEHEVWETPSHTLECGKRTGPLSNLERTVKTGNVGVSGSMEGAKKWDKEHGNQVGDNK